MRFWLNSEMFSQYFGSFVRRLLLLLHLLFFYEIDQKSVSGVCACDVESLYLYKLWMTWNEKTIITSTVWRAASQSKQNGKCVIFWNDLRSLFLFANCRFACKSQEKSEFYTQNTLSFGFFFFFVDNSRSILLTANESRHKIDWWRRHCATLLAKFHNQK